MNICFVDLMAVPEYDCDTPYERALGGTQSALCYYAEFLAAQEHNVTVVTAGCTAEHKSRGVNFTRMIYFRDIPQTFDVVVWCSGVSKQIRSSVGKLVLGGLHICWIPHHVNEPGVGDLKEALYDYDVFAFVSEWQRDTFIDTFRIPCEKTMIMYNGNAPSFHCDFDAATKSPRFIYTSQPDRGLINLVKAWPQIVEKYPTAELHTFTSRSVYGASDSTETHAMLSELRSMKNVHIHAPVSQKELAEFAAGSAFFAYPAQFYETGCIACTEACAAGCLPIVSNLGVLGAYFSNAIPFDNDLVEKFVERACHYMDIFLNNKELFAAQSERIAARFQAERDYNALVKLFVERAGGLLVRKQKAVNTFEKARNSFGEEKYTETRLMLCNMPPFFENKENAYFYYLWLGVCYYYENRHIAALNAFESAAELNETQQLCVNMILTNEALGRKNDVVKWCERSLTYGFDHNIVTKILMIVTKMSYFDRCKWGQYLLSLWNNDIHDMNWFNLFLSHGNMIVSDYTHVMKHEDGSRLMIDLITKAIAYADLHKIDLSANESLRVNIDKLFSNLFLNMNYFETSNPKMNTIFEFYKKALPDMKGSVRMLFDKIPRGRRIRVGFLSGDLMYHPVSYVLNGIVENLDKSKFEVFVFSTTKRDDANKMQSKIRGDSDKYFDLYDADVNGITSVILDQDIDLLIEMCGHTTNGTISINTLRNKPARVVAQYFAFPNSYGLEAVDFKIGDSVVFPKGLERYYTESFCKIEGGMHTYKPIIELEVKNKPHEGIVFSCFNNPKKYRPEWIKAVSSILKRVENSRLKLRYFNLNDISIREFYLKEFEKHGVSRSRVDIGVGDSLLTYFDAYGDVDIALDPWPYNGGTINIEILYCSRPYITLLGNSYVSRVGASILHQVGLPELVAKNIDEYIEKAVALANDKDRLAEYSTSIRAKAMKSTLCDNAAFTRNFEKGIMDMLEKKDMFEAEI